MKLLFSENMKISSKPHRELLLSDLKYCLTDYPALRNLSSVFQVINQYNVLLT